MRSQAGEGRNRYASEIGIPGKQSEECAQGPSHDCSR